MDVKPFVNACGGNDEISEEFAKDWNTVMSRLGLNFIVYPEEALEKYAEHCINHRDAIPPREWLKYALIKPDLISDIASELSLLNEGNIYRENGRTYGRTQYALFLDGMRYMAKNEPEKFCRMISEYGIGGFKTQMSCDESFPATITRSDGQETNISLSMNDIYKNFRQPLVHIEDEIFPAENIKVSFRSQTAQLKP